MIPILFISVTIQGLVPCERQRHLFNEWTRSRSFSLQVLWYSDIMLSNLRSATHDYTHFTDGEMKSRKRGEASRGQ